MSSVKLLIEDILVNPPKNIEDFKRSALRGPRGKNRVL